MENMENNECFQNENNVRNNESTSAFNISEVVNIKELNKDNIKGEDKDLSQQNSTIPNNKNQETAQAQSQIQNSQNAQNITAKNTSQSPTFFQKVKSFPSSAWNYLKTINYKFWHSQPIKYKYDNSNYYNDIYNKYVKSKEVHSNKPIKYSKRKDETVINYNTRMASYYTYCDAINTTGYGSLFYGL